MSRRKGWASSVLDYLNCSMGCLVLLIAVCICHRWKYPGVVVSVVFGITLLGQQIKYRSLQWVNSPEC